MTPLVWLLVAVVAGAVAVFVGLPAWRTQRERATRDLNVDRYRAWRGQSRPVGSAPQVGLTESDRRRLIAAGASAAVAVLGLVAFFVTS
jgi:hypothetical protein